MPTTSAKANAETKHANMRRRKKAPTNTENAGGDLRSLTFMHQMVPQECSDRIRKHVQIKDKHAPNEEEQASNAKPAPNGEEDAANDVHVNGSQPSVERALSQWVLR